MIECVVVEADLTFRSKSDGGRTLPPEALDGLKYRPHIVVGDPNQKEVMIDENRVCMEEHLGVAFLSGPTTVLVGEKIRVQMMLMYWPNVDYSKVQPGATFTLREGSSIVGHGLITKRWNKNRDPSRLTSE